MLQFITGSIFLISLACCTALWLRFKRDKTSSASAWLLVALAGVVPPASLLILELSPPAAFNGNFFLLSWLMGIVVGLASLLVKLPRLASGVIAGISTGCLFSLLGALTLAMLD